MTLPQRLTFVVLSIIAIPGYGANGLNVETLEQSINELNINVEATCADPKTLMLCNSTLEKTKRAMDAVKRSGVNTPEAQARLAKLKVIQLNAERLKARSGK